MMLLLKTRDLTKRNIKRRNVNRENKQKILDNIEMYMYLICLLDDSLFSHFKLIISELICLSSSFHLFNLDLDFSCYHTFDFFLLFIFIMTNNQHQENEASHEHDVEEHDVEEIQNLDSRFESVRASI